MLLFLLAERQTIEASAILALQLTGDVFSVCHV